MKTLTKITVALVAMTATAMGQGQGKTDKAPTPPAKDAKAGAVAPPAKDAKQAASAMPTVPPELAAFAKAHTGNWRCTGESVEPAGNKKVTATNKVKVDLDKWWVVESFEVKGGSMPYKMQSFTTYDAAAKKWRRVALDNWGGQMVGSADAVATPGAKLTFNLDSIGPMGASQFRDHSEGADPKAGIKIWGEMSMDKGKTWNKVYEMTCKK